MIQIASGELVKQTLDEQGYVFITNDRSDDAVFLSRPTVRKPYSKKKLSVPFLLVAPEIDEELRKITCLLVPTCFGDSQRLPTTTQRETTSSNKLWIETVGVLDKVAIRLVMCHREDNHDQEASKLQKPRPRALTGCFIRRKRAIVFRKNPASKIQMIKLIKALNKRYIDLYPYYRFYQYGILSHASTYD